MPISIVFLGSKPIGYQCLDYLISNQERLNYRITGVLTQARKEFDNLSDLRALATSNNIAIIENLGELPECDILYSVQYHEILKQEHISKARKIALNLHMAPLPEYRGCNQFSFAIIDGKKEFGTTIHQMDPRIDHGDILFEKRFSIPENCWVNDLYHLTEIASRALFKETLSDLIQGNFSSIPQKNLETERGTSIHYRSEIRALKEIDLAWPSDKIERHIRATSMPGFEAPFCRIGEQKIYFEPSEK